MAPRSWPFVLPSCLCLKWKPCVSLVLFIRMTSRAIRQRFWAQLPSNRQVPQCDLLVPSSESNHMEEHAIEKAGIFRWCGRSSSLRFCSYHPIIISISCAGMRVQNCLRFAILPTPLCDWWLRGRVAELLGLLTGCIIGWLSSWGAEELKS